MPKTIRDHSWQPWYVNPLPIERERVEGVRVALVEGQSGGPVWGWHVQRLCADLCAGVAGFGSRRPIRTLGARPPSRPGLGPVFSFAGLEDALEFCVRMRQAASLVPGVPSASLLLDRRSTRDLRHRERCESLLGLGLLEAIDS